jgi:hypothetical protein
MLANLPAVRWRSPAVLTALAVLVLGLGSCDGDDQSNSPTTTQNVSVKPSSVCNLVEERRRLGTAPPELAFDLRNSDIDNFTGRTGLECNERQLVYWGPPAPVPGQDRPATIVKFFFFDSGRRAAAAARGGLVPESMLPIGGGVQLSLFPAKGLFSARFLSGAALVTVIAGCVAENETRLEPAPCDDPPQPMSALRERSVAAATALEEQLRGRLR